MSIENLVSMFVDMMISMMIFTAGYIVYYGRYYEEVAGMIGGAGSKIRDWRAGFEKGVSEKGVSEKGVSEKSEKTGVDEDVDDDISENMLCQDVDDDISENMLCQDVGKDVDDDISENVIGQDVGEDVDEDVDENVVSRDVRIRDLIENSDDNNFEILSASAVPTPLPIPSLPPPSLLNPQKTTAEPSEDTEQQKQQQQTDHKMTALGYIDDPKGDRLFVIPEKDRQNIGIFGEIGSGKTSVLRLLIMQDIIRKTGFLLIDPHREFSRDVLSMIPPDMQQKVVYVSLASLYQFGRTVCINPLQTQTDHEKYIRTAGCIDNLKQYTVKEKSVVKTQNFSTI